MIWSIAVTTIEVGERLRDCDQQQVDAIKASIREIGLKTPITLRALPAGEDGV